MCLRKSLVKFIKLDFYIVVYNDDDDDDGIFWFFGLKISYYIRLVESFCLWFECIKFDKCYLCVSGFF